MFEFCDFIFTKIDMITYIITFVSELILKSLKRLLRSPIADVDNVYLLYTHTHTDTYKRAHTHTHTESYSFTVL